jgi:hypothetical protein
MNDFSERQLSDGSISRKYEDGTFLVYKKWDTHTIYIKLLHSINPGKGIARKHLLEFINHYSDKNIYTYVSDELGANLSKLEEFYNNHGFVEIDKSEINGDRVNYKLGIRE